MESASLTVQRIRCAMTVRGIVNCTALAELTGLSVDTLRRITSNPRTPLGREEEHAIAKALFIPPRWLTEKDPRAKPADAPAWPGTWELPLVKSLDDGAEANSPPAVPDVPADTHGSQSLIAWQETLEVHWKAFLGAMRDDRGDRQLKACLERETPDKRQWPLFHRSVVTERVTAALTPAQQHAVAEALEVPGTPEYAIVSAWAVEGDRALKIRRANNLTTAYRLAVAGQLDVAALFLPRVYAEVRDDAFHWPLATDKEGLSYRRLLGQLIKVRGSRLNGKHVADDIRRDFIVDDVVDTMQRVFRHRFPDDPQVDLLAAVRTWRAFAKKAFVTKEEQLRYRPDRGIVAAEIWAKFTSGPLIPYHWVEGSYAQCGLANEQLQADIKEKERSKEILIHRRNERLYWVLIIKEDFRYSPSLRLFRYPNKNTNLIDGGSTGA